MNNTRRNELKKAIKILESAIDYIEKIKGDEEDYMENMPENLQYGTRYCAAEEACNYLSDAIENIEDAIENIEMARI